MSDRVDIVIVGAGSAGCVLAGRLSEDPARSVLLLEAGPDRGAERAAGDSFFDALADPALTWPGTDVVRTDGARPTRYALGRGIGGSSAVNAMLGTWGLPEDYDHWERDLGCAGWGWADVSRVFARLAIATTQARPDEHGPVDLALVEAAQLLGHPRIDDALPGASALGVGPAWLTRSSGRRVSAADAYLTPARVRPNLSVRADTTVERILLDGTRATGVVTATGELVEAGEVIVAAGALQSPTLLLRSGVEHPGIGAGLKDHASASLTLRLREPAETSRLAASTLLWWSSPSAAGDLQLLPLNHVGAPEYGALVAGLMSVHSTGTVRLVGGRAVVEMRMLSDERDISRLRGAARHAAALAATEPFERIADAVFVDDHGTPVEALADLDEPAFDDWLRTDVGGYVHAACTCRMGLADDPTAVVDLDARVHRYDGLRVCDASIFPDLPTANPHLPTVMVAERIAARISAAW